MDRFWRKVDMNPHHCWDFEGAKNQDGYGIFRGPDGKNVRAHRFAYSLLVGEIPAGLELDHLCKNRSCVCPGHLEAVTRLVNVRRSDVGKHWAVKRANRKGD